MRRFRKEKGRWWTEMEGREGREGRERRGGRRVTKAGGGGTGGHNGKKRGRGGGARRGTTASVGDRSDGRKRLGGPRRGGGRCGRQRSFHRKLPRHAERRHGLWGWEPALARLLLARLTYCCRPPPGCTALWSSLLRGRDSGTLEADNDRLITYWSTSFKYQLLFRVYSTDALQH